MDDLYSLDYGPKKETSVVTQEEAIRFDKEIEELVENVNYAMQILAEKIKEFRDKKMYFALGYNSFREWYLDKRLSHTTVYRALSVAEFIERYQLPEDTKVIPQKKLDKLAVLDNHGLLNENNVGEWVEKAKELTESDFLKEYKSAIKGAERSENELPVGTYELKRLEGGREMIDMMDDNVSPLGRFIVYRKGNMFFVRVAPDD